MLWSLREGWTKRESRIGRTQTGDGCAHNREFFICETFAIFGSIPAQDQVNGKEEREAEESSVAQRLVSQSESGCAPGCATGGLAAGLRSGLSHRWGFGLLLLVATVVAYLPCLRGGFVWDDDSWTARIAELPAGFTGLWTIWSKPTALQQFYPLSGTTFWLDCHLWGWHTLPYHVENVLLHACAALLFWRLLRRLEVPGARLAGAVFALHPLMVESAGWITERKNVFSLVLYLGALLAYGRFARFWKADDAPPPEAKAAPPERWSGYAFAFLLFAGALLAKATAFSLPAVLLLICWWKRGHIRWQADVLPSLPFFAFTLGLGLVTAWLEKHHVGAAGAEWALSFPERCLIAGRALWFYAGKLFWPAKLCFVYPRWQLDAGSLAQWLYPATAAGALVGLWLARQRIGRGPATAAFFFAGTLFPLLGFMNAYFMRYSFVCDHWTYLSSLGLIALGAALVARVGERLRAPKLLYGFAAVVLPVLGGLTWEQSKMYGDIETLNRATIGWPGAGLNSSVSAPARWHTRVRVRLDGRAVLEGESPCHPSERTQIRLAENPIGGSTCGPRFTGQVRAVERTALPKD